MDEQMNQEQPASPKGGGNNMLLIIALVVAVALIAWWLMASSQTPVDQQNGTQDEVDVSVEGEFPLPDETDTPEMEVQEE